METDATAHRVNGVVDCALNLQRRYERLTSIEERKRKGQYFTVKLHTSGGTST